MTKPTDEQIEGALIYVGKMRKWAIEEEDNNHLDVIRTALEEYKPKMVTREWVGKATEFLCEMSESGGLMDVHLVAILDELGIEVGE